MNESAKLVFDKLIKNKLTISFCESATGGMLSSLICSFDHASDVFYGSFITYASMIKHKVLNISNDLINQRGTINQDVAYLMVKNAQVIFNTDLCVSVTGNSSIITTIENKDACLYYVGIYYQNQIKIFKVKLKAQNDCNQNRLNICNWIFHKLASILS